MCKSEDINLPFSSKSKTGSTKKVSSPGNGRAIEIIILENGDLWITNVLPQDEKLIAEFGTRKDSHSLYCG